METLDTAGNRAPPSPRWARVSMVLATGVLPAASRPGVALLGPPGQGPVGLHPPRKRPGAASACLRRFTAARWRACR